jgi:predicted TIM-barrel fold metal-dependent hydrolase
MTETVALRVDPKLTGGPVIDCDLHCNVPKIDALFPYLSDFWREYCTQSAFRGPVDTAYPKGHRTTARPESGSPPGSSVDLLREQALDPWNAEIGILTCSYAIESIHNPDTAANLAAAVNDWMAAEWLDKEPRLRGTIVIPVQQPEMAANEIERVAKDRRFVQVHMPARSSMLYGNRHFHPIYEAAARHDLVIQMHFGGAPGNPPTPTGWPSHYVEEYVGMGQVCESQIMNIIAEGVFDRFPTLRWVVAEAGWAWVPAWMWRMDKEWKGLRREIPWVRDAPSEYMRRHMRWTLQPVDPPDVIQFLRIVEEMGSDELLLFSTDWPHWQWDTPEEALPPDLPDELRRKIAYNNARAFYHRL